MRPRIFFFFVLVRRSFTDIEGKSPTQAGPVRPFACPHTSLSELLHGYNYVHC